MGNANIKAILIIIACAGMMLGCASTGEQKETKAGSPVMGFQTIQQFFESESKKSAKQAGPSTLPVSVSQALLPAEPLQHVPAAPKKVEARFDVEVNNVGARAFFISLIKDTPYNMVVHPEVKGNITLNLKDVTIADVMQTVYEVYGYEYESSSRGFIVYPNKLQSKIFKVDYLNVVRQGQSATRVSSGQLTQGSRSSSDSESNTKTESKSSTVLAASDIKTTSTLDFWTELQVAAESIIGAGEGKSVVVSPQSGLIVVRALPADLRKVEQFLRSTEGIMQRQVIIEAKVLEVELSDGYQQGINWAHLSDSGNVLSGQTGGGSLLKNDQSIIANSIGNLDPANFSQIAGNVASAFGGMFSLAVNSGNFTAFFEFLKTQGNLQVLSSPRVSTVNNQKAVIKVGSDEFFVTGISTTTTTGTSTTTTPEVTLTPFFSGISLDVTPQIDADGSIILHIHPTISEVNDQEKTIRIAGDVLDLPLAFSEVRESDSVVRAKNGQIVVIGGLMKNKTVEQESATPVISSIPFLGEMFKHKKDISIKSELVILLRPVVVDHDDVWGNVISESSQRVNQMYHGYGR